MNLFPNADSANRIFYGVTKNLNQSWNKEPLKEFPQSNFFLYKIWLFKAIGFCAVNYCIRAGAKEKGHLPFQLRQIWLS